jgi:hypothetical protein
VFPGLGLFVISLTLSAWIIGDANKEIVRSKVAGHGAPISLHNSASTSWLDPVESALSLGVNNCSSSEDAATVDFAVNLVRSFGSSSPSSFVPLEIEAEDTILDIQRHKCPLLFNSFAYWNVHKRLIVFCLPPTTKMKMGRPTTSRTKSCVFSFAHRAK